MKKRNAIVVKNKGITNRKHPQFSNMRLAMSGVALALMGLWTPLLAEEMHASFTPPPELCSAQKWEDFKALWQALDRVKAAYPKQIPMNGKNFIPIEKIPVDDIFTKTSQPSLPGYEKRPYYQALNQQQAEKFYQSLFDIFSLPAPEVGKNRGSIDSYLAKKQVSEETRALARLLELRIQEMSAPTFRLSNLDLSDFPTCRAAIPACMGPKIVDIPPSLYLVSAIDRIEARVDALMVLRAKGVLETNAFNTALAALQRDAKLVLHLDVLTQITNLKESSRHLETFPWLSKSDFNGNPNGGAAVEINLEDFQTWERAFQSSSERLLQQEKRVTAADCNDNKQNCKERQKRLDKKTSEQKKLIQRLADLRAIHQRLDELLAELER